MDNPVSECAGLWLAEGDNKSRSEITFTNNCFDLIAFFYKTILCKYPGNPRVYVYSSRPAPDRIQLGSCIVKHYSDPRASRPYYIVRLGSVAAIKDWRQKVERALNDQNQYPSILRGFFAGEGSIKTGSHHQRLLRIAQKCPKDFIDTLLRELGLTFRYKARGRTYELSGKWNWDIFARHHLANLHPVKKERFWATFNQFKEVHYPRHYLKKNVLEHLKTPKTTKQLATQLNRSCARICDVLMELKREDKIKSFKTNGGTYWAVFGTLILSKSKSQYLELLQAGFSRPCEFSSRFSVTWMSARKRLTELEALGLANVYKGRWSAIPTDARVVVV